MSTGTNAQAPVVAQRKNLPLARRRLEAAQYITDMILELRNMAKSVQLYQVLVPLEYAYYEAFAEANKIIAPPEEVQRLRELSKIASESDSATPPEE